MVGTVLWKHGKMRGDEALIDTASTSEACLLRFCGKEKAKVPVLLRVKADTFEVLRERFGC